LSAVRDLLPVEPWPGIEAGVGTGRFASALGIRYGIDPSTQMLSMARDRGIEVIRGVGESLPVRSGTFVTYLMVTALEFVASPRRVMSEAARVLAPGGRAVFGFIPRDSAWGRAYRHAAAAGDPVFREARFLIPSELDAMADEQALRRVEARSTLLHAPGEQSMGDVLEGTVAEAGFIAYAYGRRG